MASQLTNEFVVSGIVEVFMSKIALRIIVRVDDWTAKWAIIVSTDFKWTILQRQRSNNSGGKKSKEKFHLQFRNR